jgi:hypothetical protein
MTTNKQNNAHLIQAQIESAHAALQYWAAKDIDAPECVQEALDHLNAALEIVRILTPTADLSRADGLDIVEKLRNKASTDPLDDLSYAASLIEAYRKHRTVDGHNGRRWDPLAQQKAEAMIKILEKENSLTISQLTGLLWSPDGTMTSLNQNKDN